MQEVKEYAGYDQTFKRINYILNTVIVEDLPANYLIGMATVKVVSTDAGDASIVTVFGYKPGGYSSEEITLDGVNQVEGAIEWTYVCGMILGSSSELDALGNGNGELKDLCAGDIVLYQDDGATEILTVSAGDYSGGIMNFNFNVEDITIHVLSGNVWVKDSVVTQLDTLRGKKLTAGMVIDLNVKDRISIISDATGAVIEVICWE